MHFWKLSWVFKMTIISSLFLCKCPAVVFCWNIDIDWGHASEMIECVLRTWMFLHILRGLVEGCVPCWRRWYSLVTNCSVWEYLHMCFKERWILRDESHGIFYVIIMQVRLESELQTNEIVPILAHAQQHYWELNIIVACSN